MQAQILTILYTAFVMWLTATLILLVYSFRSNKGNFSVVCWFQTNTNRFIVGAIVIGALSILMVVEPDITALLAVFGFKPDKSPLPLGIAIGTFLIAGVSGNPADKSAENI